MSNPCPRTIMVQSRKMMLLRWTGNDAINNGLFLLLGEELHDGVGALWIAAAGWNLPLNTPIKSCSWFSPGGWCHWGRQGTTQLMRNWRWTLPDVGGRAALWDSVDFRIAVAGWKFAGVGPLNALMKSCPGRMSSLSSDPKMRWSGNYCHIVIVVGLRYRRIERALLLRATENPGRCYKVLRGPRNLAYGRREVPCLLTIFRVRCCFDKKMYWIGFGFDVWRYCIYSHDSARK